MLTFLYISHIISTNLHIYFITFNYISLVQHIFCTALTIASARFTIKNLTVIALSFPCALSKHNCRFTFTFPFPYTFSFQTFEFKHKQSTICRGETYAMRYRMIRASFNSYCTNG